MKTFYEKGTIVKMKDRIEDLQFFDSVRGMEKAVGRFLKIKRTNNRTYEHHGKIAYTLEPLTFEEYVKFIDCNMQYYEYENYVELVTLASGYYWIDTCFDNLSSGDLNDYEEMLMRNYKYL